MAEVVVYLPLAQVGDMAEAPAEVVVLAEDLHLALVPVYHVPAPVLAPAVVVQDAVRK